MDGASNKKSWKKDQEWMENYDLLTPGSKQVNGTKNDSSINNIKEKKDLFSTLVSAKLLFSNKYANCEYCIRAFSYNKDRLNHFFMSTNNI